MLKCNYLHFNNRGLDKFHAELRPLHNKTMKYSSYKLYFNSSPLIFNLAYFSQSRIFFSFLKKNILTVKTCAGKSGAHISGRSKHLKIRGGQSVENKFITQTRPCNIQQYFTALKRLIFR